MSHSRWDYITSVDWGKLTQSDTICGKKRLSVRSNHWEYNLWKYVFRSVCSLHTSVKVHLRFVFRSKTKAATLDVLFPTINPFFVVFYSISVKCWASKIVLLTQLKKNSQAFVNTPTSPSCLTSCNDRPWVHWPQPWCFCCSPPPMFVRSSQQWMTDRERGGGGGWKWQMSPTVVPKCSSHPWWGVRDKQSIILHDGPPS